MSPTFGTSGVQGAVQWKWSLLLQQTVFIQYCTSDWISTPLTLVDTCQVNDIWKDGLGRVYTVHPHWTATLFKSMRLLIPSIISKHRAYPAQLDVNGLKSDLALYKIWHIAAKLSHETNLAITKLSLSLIHNTIGLGLPMFLNATTRQQISIYSIGSPILIFACLYPHI